MDSIVETQRQTHEELDRYEQALADVLMQNPTVQRNITRRDRKAADLLGRIEQLRKDLLSQYEDLPGLRPQELQLLSQPPAGEDELAEFYKRFEGVKDFHSRNKNINTRQFINDLDELVKGDGLQVVQMEDDEEPMIIERKWSILNMQREGHTHVLIDVAMDSVFSGEEAYGKHLDLYLSHTQYLNLKGSSRLSYFGYLDMLRQGKVERTLDVREKSLPAYLEYVQTLYNYLLSFFDRALPLIDIHARIKEEEERFEAAWAAGQVEGWEAESGKKAAPVGEGIWCPYCQKNYSKQTVYDAHLNSEKHKKKEKAGVTAADPSKANGSSTPVASSSSARDKLRPPARLTFLVHSLLATDPVPTRLQASRDEVQRRMALTSREREEELEQQEEQAPPAETATGEEEDEEDEDGKIYNPLKLPLGWDGKPIPFWLYKLHGLGVTFECELCSENYRGRKAFDRHFSEARHSFAMRALGLPNTKHFHGITKIQDALSLAEKLKQEGRAEMVQASKAIEEEDEAGNVYSQDVYIQLKKQGVI